MKHKIATDTQTKSNFRRKSYKTRITNVNKLFPSKGLTINGEVPTTEVQYIQDYTSLRFFIGVFLV